MNEKQATPAQGFPLSALFVLMATCATLFAFLPSVAKVLGEAGAENAIAILITGAVLGMVSAAAVCWYFGSWTILAWGVPVGVVVGCTTLPVIWMPLEDAGLVIGLGLGGALLNLTLATIMSRSGR